MFYNDSVDELSWLFTCRLIVTRSSSYLRHMIVTNTLENICEWISFSNFRFYNDSVNAGAEEYIPKKLFVVGGDESGETTTCHGDSGSPVVRRVASSRIGTRLVMIVRV